jgi:hypothetical protein
MACNAIDAIVLVNSCWREMRESPSRAILSAPTQLSLTVVSFAREAMLCWSSQYCASAAVDATTVNEDTGTSAATPASPGEKRRCAHHSHKRQRSQHDQRRRSVRRPQRNDHGPTSGPQPRHASIRRRRPDRRRPARHVNSRRAPGGLRRHGHLRPHRHLDQNSHRDRSDGIKSPTAANDNQPPISPTGIAATTTP